MMNIVALVGSLRKDSYNRKLAEWMRERYKDKFQLDIADIGALPHYNQDDELNPPEVVAAFKRQVANADGVLIVTPEYNWSVPGVLKNALDWLSRVDKVLVNKPVMIAGVSTGMMGTIRAQLHLRQILQSPGLAAKVLPPAGNEVLVNVASQKFDEAGNLVDAATVEFLDQVIGRFIEWVGR
ncbi:NADPH-dependent FMN reductase [Geobacillus thermocatenulatus]|uniref:NADPH-dependent FMN reductase n=2 Tax=Anoxybacillaceae TaxID=3120669 RepID=A0AA91QMN9_9BACL|nr:NADPH-dependent FMN reductase [Geobacillus thermocatenulatus]